MTTFHSYSQQDTIKPQFVIKIKTDKLLSDSVYRKLDEVPAYIRYADSLRGKRKVQLREITNTDSTSVCSRNSIADITLYDSLGFTRNLKSFTPPRIPYQLFSVKEPAIKEYSYSVIRNLKEGSPLPGSILHHDWVTLITIFVICVWIIVRSTTRSLIPQLTRFILFRGVNESASRDTGALFTWYSTLLNFVSFLIIGLFGYCVAEWYNLIPSGFPGFLLLLISLGVVIVDITSLHLICLATGRLSGQTEVFNEYIFTIYQSFRFCSLGLFGLIILMIYTALVPPQICLIAGAVVLSAFYILRVMRLFLIFMKRDISILYLILYLCALEILPVLILFKYLSGLS